MTAGEWLKGVAVVFVTCFLSGCSWQDLLISEYLLDKGDCQVNISPFEKPRREGELFALVPGEYKGCKYLQAKLGAKEDGFWDSYVQVRNQSCLLAIATPLAGIHSKPVVRDENYLFALEQNAKFAEELVHRLGLKKVTRVSIKYIPKGNRSELCDLE